MENTYSYDKIGDLNCTLESEVVDGKLYDTKVSIESGIVCYIAGSEKSAFINELNDIISKYRI
jgi:hypothetical protein